MRVVIDIPEKVYKYLKQEWVKVPEDDSVINQIMYGILHGTVLPKGYGDLIDRDNLRKTMQSYADDQYAENEYLGECSVMSYIDEAPVIIPADKGE